MAEEVSPGNGRNFATTKPDVGGSVPSIPRRWQPEQAEDVGFPMRPGRGSSPQENRSKERDR